MKTGVVVQLKTGVVVQLKTGVVVQLKTGVVVQRCCRAHWYHDLLLPPVAANMPQVGI